jgi:cell division protein FtsN
MTSRNARRTPRPASIPRAPRKSGAGGTLLGLFIGIAMGLSLAAAVAFYLMKSGNPYQALSTTKEAAHEPTREPAKTGKPEPGAAEKPRFDFYKILPGIEEPKVQAKGAERPAPDRATVERAASPEKTSEKAPDRNVAKLEERTPAESSRTAKAAERFWLQAGSFAAEGDAENLRARLALAGWEAAVQPASLPDKGVRYRVRLGPYDNTDELNRVKGELGKRGFDVAVIKY